MYSNLSVLIVVGDFYKEISQMLIEGATAKLKSASSAIKQEIIRVPGSFEIPPALSFAIMSDRESYDGYIALGCIIKGATQHNEHISRAIYSSISEIATHHAVPVGTGIITADNGEEAMKRASPTDLDYGGRAASAMLRMIELYKRFLG
ncbi:6,7-dimethyl-8-ribityllumazine synthase [Anaplasma bovis]|uniref:6,7-dimethyl-8-ribityllumazine synthase n=1 Tax=Anaplasma bovis TaxID=186733 RepID=UPI002FEE96A8